MGNHNKRLKNVLPFCLLIFLLFSNAAFAQDAAKNDPRQELAAKINKVKSYGESLDAKLKSAGSKTKIIKLREMIRQNQLRLNKLQSELEKIDRTNDSQKITSDEQPLPLPIAPPVPDKSKVSLGLGFGNVAGISAMELEGMLFFDDMSAAKASIGFLSGAGTDRVSRSHTIISADYIYNLENLVNNIGISGWFGACEFYEGIGLNLDLNISGLGSGGVGGELYLGAEYPLPYKWGDVFGEVGYGVVRGQGLTLKGVNALVGFRSAIF